MYSIFREFLILQSKFRQYEFASAEILEQIHTVSIFKKKENQDLRIRQNI